MIIPETSREHLNNDRPTLIDVWYLWSGSRKDARFKTSRLIQQHDCIHILVFFSTRFACL